MNQDQKHEKPPFWETKWKRTTMWVVLWGCCILTLVLEIFIHPKHHFHFVEFPLASATLGFVACSLMIIGAKALGLLLKKKEDYYNTDERF